jgi:hypothetical protein
MTPSMGETPLPGATDARATREQHGRKPQPLDPHIICAGVSAVRTWWSSVAALHVVEKSRIGVLPYPGWDVPG